MSSDLQIKNPQVNIEINRDKASALGVTAEQIETALSTAYASRQISTILTPNNQYQVIMELEPQYQMDTSALSLLYIRSSQGKLVPLNTVVNLSSGSGPLSVNHLGQIPCVTISFNLRPDVALSDAIAAVDSTGAHHLARQHHDELSRDGPGISVVRAGLVAPADHDHCDHLYHFGDPLRELHSSINHSFRPSFGRVRRVIDSVDLPQRPEPLCLCWPDHADRHREEECNYDD